MAELLSTVPENSPPLNAPSDGTEQIILVISVGRALTFILKFNRFPRLRREIEINILSESN